MNSLYTVYNSTFMLKYGVFLVYWPPEVGYTKKKKQKGKMPLYDLMLLLKPHVQKEPLMDLVFKVGKHIYRRNGVLTDAKSCGHVQLGYGIKKLDNRYYQGQLMQMTMMAPPSFNSELHYLNKEDRLLRWLLVKHRDFKHELDFLNEDDPKLDWRKFGSNSSDDEDSESSEDDGDYEYQVEQGDKKDT